MKTYNNFYQPRQLRGRTWMSLRDRYLKIILPNLSSYQLPPHQEELLSQSKKNDSAKSYGLLRSSSIADDSIDEDKDDKKSKSVKILNKCDQILTESPALPSEVKRKANMLKIPNQKNDMKNANKKKVNHTKGKI